MNGDMKALLDHQKEIRMWLQDVNRKIARLEDQYLDDTTNGNIIRGWDVEGRNSVVGTATTSSRVRGVDGKEKLFSNSSYKVWVAAQSAAETSSSTLQGYGAPLVKQSSGTAAYSNISNYTYNKSDLYPPSTKRKRRERKVEDSDEDYF